MLDLLRNTSFLLGRSFQHRVRRYVIDKMLPQIRSEVTNQRGEHVLELQNTGMFLMREAAQ